MSDLEVEKLSDFTHVVQELSVLQSRLKVEHGHAVSVLQHQRSQLQYHNKELVDEVARLRHDLQHNLRRIDEEVILSPQFPPSDAPEFAKASASPRLMGTASTPQVSFKPEPSDSIDGEFDTILDEREEKHEAAVLHKVPVKSSILSMGASRDPKRVSMVSAASVVMLDDECGVDAPEPLAVKPYISDMPYESSFQIGSMKINHGNEAEDGEANYVATNGAAGPAALTQSRGKVAPGIFQPASRVSASVTFSTTSQNTRLSKKSGQPDDSQAQLVSDALGDMANNYNKRALQSLFSITDEDQRRRMAAVFASSNVHDMSKTIEFTVLSTREKIKTVVSSMYFEMFFAFVIVTNSIFMGVTIDYSVTYPGRANPTSFYVVGYFYTFLFAVELALRLAADGWHFFCSKSNWQWHYLDFGIVLSSLIEVILDVVELTSSGDSKDEDSVNMSNVRIVRIIRITRLIKVFRVARIVRFVRALRTLVYSILCTLKSVVWALLLLFMIIYVFGMIFAQAVSDFIVENADDYMLELWIYWGTLPRSMFTLYKSIAGGLSWQDAIHPLSDLDGVWVFMFIAYISFTFFAVLNTITGVFCEAAIESARQDHEMVIQQHLANKRKYTQQIRSLFQELDDDGSAMITFKELEQVLNDEKTVAFLATLELDASDAWELFKLLDSDDSKTIDIDEFVTGCMRLKGAAKAIDIAKISYDNKMMSRKLSRFMKEVEENLVYIRKANDDLRLSRSENLKGEACMVPNSSLLSLK